MVVPIEIFFGKQLLNLALIHVTQEISSPYIYMYDLKFFFLLHYSI